MPYNEMDSVAQGFRLINLQHVTHSRVLQKFVPDAILTSHTTYTEFDEYQTRMQR